MWRFFKYCIFASAVTLSLLAIFVIALTFREQTIPNTFFEFVANNAVGTNITIRAKSVSFSFLSGLTIDGFAALTPASNNSTNQKTLASAERIEINPLRRYVKATAFKYERLPDSYYAPINIARNEKINIALPTIPSFQLVLIKPEVLSVAPDRVVADVSISPSRLVVDRVRLDWPDVGEKMFLDGSCTLDVAGQRVFGSVYGSANQALIRPFLITLDIPSAMPYFDAFTEVPGKIPSSCDWDVNLVNNDLDLHLSLHPTLGRYNNVPMSKADGDLYLHVYTRDGWLNYSHQFGPIIAVGPNGEPLEGTVKVSGTNGYNTVAVDAKSALPVADLLEIGGFTGDYVDNDIFGDCKCNLVFKFPRSMTNNYEVLNGSGHMEIRNGQIMRMKGFKGLLNLLAEKVPGISNFTDSTQASCDYVIENGVLKTDNIYIEGAVFSIKMYGKFDAPNDKLDFVVRVQFTKRDSFMGKILHPLAWPFTKLLLEFKLTGSPQNPQWHYISVIDRVVEAAK